MSFDVTTLALAKSYTDQHSGSGGGTSTADGIRYTNEYLVGTTNVKGALDVLVPKSHDHDNKDTLDKLSVSNGKLQYNGSDVGLKGTDGHTPVKGTDYWTAADKQEMVNEVLAALPDGTEVSY